MSSETKVRWRWHPGTRKWHAWTSDAQSVCGFTRIGSHDAATIPAGGRPCLICDAVLCGTRHPTPAAAPVPAAPEEYEVMWATFEGGPFDGERVPLRVLRLNATTHRVLTAQYSRAEIAKEIAATTPGQVGPANRTGD